MFAFDPVARRFRWVTLERDTVLSVDAASRQDVRVPPGSEVPPSADPLDVSAPWCRGRFDAPGSPPGSIAAGPTGPDAQHVHDADLARRIPQGQPLMPNYSGARVSAWERVPSESPNHPLAQQVLRYLRSQAAIGTVKQETIQDFEKHKDV
jgi:hypothetical protein